MMIKESLRDTSVVGSSGSDPTEEIFDPFQF